MLGFVFTISGAAQQYRKKVCNMKNSGIFQLTMRFDHRLASVLRLAPVYCVVTVLAATPVVSLPALADKNTAGGFVDAGSALSAPAGRSNLQPSLLFNGKPVVGPGGTTPNSSTWSNSNPSGSLVIPSGTVMVIPASASYVWNAITHPLPLNPAAPRNLELGTWTIKDKSKNTIVGTWTWIASNQNFSGSYTNGIVETLRLDQFTGRNIAISGFNSYGVAVDYIGTRTSPNTAEGTATAHAATGPLTWMFDASW